VSEAALRYSYDPETLRESYADPSAARARVDELRAELRDVPDVVAELASRGELVDLLRGLGDLDDALTEARRAVDRADMVGNPAQQHTARSRLAQVHQWRGEFTHSTLILTELLAVADRFGPVIEAYTHQHAGSNDFDQGHLADAHGHFAQALGIREALEVEEAESSRIALAAAVRRLEHT
jgi:hypothetical protein